MFFSGVVSYVFSDVVYYVFSCVVSYVFSDVVSYVFSDVDSYVVSNVAFYVVSYVRLFNRVSEMLQVKFHTFATKKKCILILLIKIESKKLWRFIKTTHSSSFYLNLVLSLRYE